MMYVSGVYDQAGGQSISAISSLSWFQIFNVSRFIGLFDQVYCNPYARSVYYPPTVWGRPVPGLQAAQAAHVQPTIDADYPLSGGDHAQPTSWISVSL